MYGFLGNPTSNTQLYNGQHLQSEGFILVLGFGWCHVDSFRSHSFDGFQKTDLQDMPLMSSQRGQIIRWHSARSQQWWARCGNFPPCLGSIFFGGLGRGTLKWISGNLYLKKVQQKFRSTLIWHLAMQETPPSQVAFINSIRILLVEWRIVLALACLGVRV